MSRRWSYSAGEWGVNRVRVYERSNGIIYAAATDPNTKEEIRVSLGHRDRDKAKAYAEEQAAKIRQGLADLDSSRGALGHILSEYLRYVLPERRTDAQRHRDHQRRDLWVTYFGSKKDASTITPAEWKQFQRQRFSGAIDARGRPAGPDGRRPVRARTVVADLVWLRGALTWASEWTDQHGRPLLSTNPTGRKKVYSLPEERNPLRVIASQDHFEAVRAEAHGTRCKGLDGEQNTYLLELMDLAHNTGRRITAICRLRYGDLRLEANGKAPYGAIRWRAEHDKQGRETVAPLNPDARAAIDRALRRRPGLGDAWIFPHPMRPTEPLPRYMAQHWLLRAESYAGIDHVKGFGFHSLRRGWATARKHLPAPDVAEAGGWKGPHTLQYVYQGADEDTMLKVVLEPARVREAVR